MVAYSRVGVSRVTTRLQSLAVRDQRLDLSPQPVIDLKTKGHLHNVTTPRRSSGPGHRSFIPKQPLHRLDLTNHVTGDSSVLTGRGVAAGEVIASGGVDVVGQGVLDRQPCLRTIWRMPQRGRPAAPVPWYFARARTRATALPSGERGYAVQPSGKAAIPPASTVCVGSDRLSSCQRRDRQSRPANLDRYNQVGRYPRRMYRRIVAALPGSAPTI